MFLEVHAPTPSPTTLLVLKWCCFSFACLNHCPGNGQLFNTSMSRDISLFDFFVCLFFVLSSSVGCVFCDPKEPIKVCTRFRARVLIFNIEVPITKGFPVSLWKLCLWQVVQGFSSLCLTSWIRDTVRIQKWFCLSRGNRFFCNLTWIEGATVAVYAYSYWLLIHSWAISENVNSTTARL